MKPGRAAVAELLRQMLVATAGDEATEVQAERLWPAFRDAVGEAISELHEHQVRGIQRWREARHGSPERA